MDNTEQGATVLGRLPPPSIRKSAMLEPNFVILYVANPQESAVFYARLLGRPPVESSPTFAMFSLNAGVMLGLWSRHTVQPQAIAAGGGGDRDRRRQ